MSNEVLAFIASRLKAAGIPYAFIRWEEKPPDPYFVGEYLEAPTPTREENGRQQSTFILRGYTRGSWMELEEMKSTIERVLPVTAILPSGAGVCITYASGMPVPTASAIKSIKIDFQIDEWKVN